MKADQIARAIALRKAGWPIDRIASRLRKGHPAISACLKSAGFSLTNGGARFRGVAKAHDIATKTCLGPCGEQLPLLEFYKNRSKDDGRHDRCRVCMSAYQQVEYGNRVKARTEERKASGPNGHRVVRVMPPTADVPADDATPMWVSPVPLLEREGPMSDVPIDDLCRGIDKPRPKRWAL